MSEEMLDYGEMKNNLLVYKSKEQVADICIAHYKEIERLNNIINELEKWLDKQVDFYESYYTIDEYNSYCFCLTKLQELKNCTKESQNDAIKSNDEAIEGGK